MSDLIAWLSRITNGDTPRLIAKKVPYSYSTIARWIRADSIPCEAIVKIAVAYRANVLEALVTGKHISSQDTYISTDTEAVLRSAPSHMLAIEVTRRLEAYEKTLRDIDLPRRVQ